MSNYENSLSRKLYYAVKTFLKKYDEFHDTGTIEANKACNSARQRLDVVIDDLANLLL